MINIIILLVILFLKIGNLKEYFKLEVKNSKLSKFKNFSKFWSSFSLFYLQLF